MKLLNIVALLSLVLVAPLQAKTPLLDQNFRPLAGKTPVNLQKAYRGQVLLAVALRCLAFHRTILVVRILAAKKRSKNFAASPMA